MNDIMVLQDELQQLMNLARGPGTNKLIVLRLRFESCSVELEKGLYQIGQVLYLGSERKVLWLKWPIHKEDLQETFQSLVWHKSALTFTINSDLMSVPILTGVIVYANICPGWLLFKLTIELRKVMIHIKLLSIRTN